jgi:glycosyltransferase involved in cell wall biosynthesis
MKSISAVVPVYNEEACIVPLHAELDAALRAFGRPYEIIYINDGSTDSTLSVLQSLASVTIIDLQRNFGQATALDAGFRAAQHDLIVSLDGDGQNDPNDIGRLIGKLESDNLDVVAGWRQMRHDAHSVRVLTRIGRALRRLFIADLVHDSGCTLRVYRRACAQSLDIGGEMHRYIMALLRWKGFRIGELAVNHRPRNGGTSKYGASKAIRGFIDLVYIWFIYKYSQRPLHLFGYMSLLSFVLGVLCAVWTVRNYFVVGIHIARDVWVVVAFLFFLTSVIFFSFGIILDLCIRMYHNTSPFEKRYYIRSITTTYL